MALPILTDRADTLRYEGGTVAILDRRALPEQVAWVTCHSCEEGLPETFLARELGMHDAALALVGPPAPILEAALLAAAGRPARPGPGVCGCGEPIAQLQRQGIVDPDWHTWCR